MPVAANPVLWSDVPEISNVDGDEHMTLLKKTSTSPDVTEWRRYEIGKYFQAIEDRFNQLEALLAPPESGTETLVSVTSGVSLTGSIDWHRVMNRVFFHASLSVTITSSNTFFFRIAGLPYRPARLDEGIGTVASSNMFVSYTVQPLQTNHPNGDILVMNVNGNSFSTGGVSIVLSGSYEI